MKRVFTLGFHGLSPLTNQKKRSWGAWVFLKCAWIMKPQCSALWDKPFFRPEPEDLAVMGWAVPCTCFAQSYSSPQEIKPLVPSDPNGSGYGRDVWCCTCATSPCLGGYVVRRGPLPGWHSFNTSKGWFSRDTQAIWPVVGPGQMFWWLQNAYWERIM